MTKTKLYETSDFFDISLLTFGIHWLQKNSSKALVNSPVLDLDFLQCVEHWLKPFVVNGLAEVRHLVAVGVEHSLVVVE